MPASTTIILEDDGQAETTLYPVQKSVNGTWTLLSRGALTAAGAMKLDLGFSLGNRNRATDKTFAKLTVPFEATVDGKPVVVASCIFDSTFVVPVDLSASQRAKFAALASSMIGHSILKGYVKDRDPLF